MIYILAVYLALEMDYGSVSSNLTLLIDVFSFGHTCLVLSIFGFS